ncbi:MAG: GAF domain-containing protein [Bacteroidia bacterium]|nr:GAF domain-containing protein [Bacteroidia bacterium]
MNNIKSLNTSILMQQLDTDVTRELLGGLSGEKILTYNGEERLAVFAPLSIPQLKWGVITEISTNEAFHTIAAFEHEMTIAALSLLIICLACASWFARKFTRPVTTIEQTLTQLTMGGFPENILVTAEDELGRTSQALNKLVTRVKSASSFAAAIGQGDLDATYDSGDGDDVLSQALRSMRDNLKNHADKDARHDWVVEGLARFGEMIRSNANDMSRLADQVLTGIIRYINANQGAIYFKESDGDQLHQLRRIATFAWGKQKFESELLERGEGLVGQCVLEGHKIILTDVPSNFVKITSGLGLATPRWVGIFPLSIESEVVGVLEIASMEVMQSYQVELIEKLCSSVALSVHHSHVNEQTRNLLHASRAMSEDLKAQEEELRQSQEELSATQEDLQRRLDAALLENKQLKEELGSLKKTKTFSVPAQFGKGLGKQMNGTFAGSGFAKL